MSHTSVTSRKSVFSQLLVLSLLLGVVFNSYSQEAVSGAFYEDDNELPINDSVPYPKPLMIDLGLSVKWAECNLGASSPFMEGKYFAWGETTPSADNQFTMWHYLSEQDSTIIKDSYTTLIDLTNQISLKANPFAAYRQLLPIYDASGVQLGSDCRMPTSDEWKELKSLCKFKLVKIGKKKCIRVTGPNGNSIFFILSGNYEASANDSQSKRTRHGMSSYWSSDLKDGKAIDFTFTDFGRYSLTMVNPWNGLQIRPVADVVIKKQTADNTVADTHNPAIQPQTVVVPVPKQIRDEDKAIVEWIGLPKETTDRTMTLKIGIKSPSAIKATAFFINGQMTRGIKAVNNDGYDMVLTPSVTFAKGINTLRLEIMNGAGKTVEEVPVIYYPEGAKTAADFEVPTVEAERRVALVVGNANYPGNELANPANDAYDLAEKLRSLDFDVTLLLDAGKRELEEQIASFAEKAAQCDVAMFFFAGHGIQYNGANYLIPVDATLRSARDVEYETTDVNRVLAYMEDSGCKVNILSLDACRNNPFERRWGKRRTDAGIRGLSAINAPIGSFISYATAPGNVANDGYDRNSPYTTALLRALDQPGLTIENVFKRVAADVYISTDHSQTPWYSSSLFQGDFYFNLPK